MINEGRFEVRVTYYGAAGGTVGDFRSTGVFNIQIVGHVGVYSLITTHHIDWPAANRSFFIHGDVDELLPSGKVKPILHALLDLDIFGLTLSASTSSLVNLCDLFAFVFSARSKLKTLTFSADSSPSENVIFSLIGALEEWTQKRDTTALQSIHLHPAEFLDRCKRKLVSALQVLENKVFKRASLGNELGFPEEFFLILTIEDAITIQVCDILGTTMWNYTVRYLSTYSDEIQSSGPREHGNKNAERSINET